MDESFFEEYTSRDAILKYTKGTAGYGISYLLDHDYKEVYLNAVALLPADVKQRGIRVLEFGCGGGMNLVHLVSVLNQKGISINKAVGTDFSPVLVDAAKKESNNYLQPEDRNKVDFIVARNESLVADLSAAGHAGSGSLFGSFDFILGVNTFRYCHRSGSEMACAQDIKSLLSPGGICVNIDMNNRFPAFRSAIKNKFRTMKEEECYVPSLQEYASPFEKNGFEILRKEHFCWIAHSAGPALCLALRIASPFLNVLAKSRAMRSLVVARKPAST
jgi:SAM-dependent methyltransferase